MQHQQRVSTKRMPGRCTSIECPREGSPEDEMLQSQSVIRAWSSAAVLQQGVFESVTNLPCPAVWCIANTHNRLCTTTASLQQRGKKSQVTFDKYCLWLYSLSQMHPGPIHRVNLRKRWGIVCAVIHGLDITGTFWSLPNHCFMITQGHIFSSLSLSVQIKAVLSCGLEGIFLLI